MYFTKLVGLSTATTVFISETTETESSSALWKAVIQKRCPIQVQSLRPALWDSNTRNNYNNYIIKWIEYCKSNQIWDPYQEFNKKAIFLDTYASRMTVHIKYDFLLRKIFRGILSEAIFNKEIATFRWGNWPLNIDTYSHCTFSPLLDNTLKRKQNIWGGSCRI